MCDFFYDQKNCNNTEINTTQNRKQNAVRVKNLVFLYSARNTKVLNNCNINVPKGEIYALLGSNGCGKTTLINCIIGRLRPQSGQIITFGVPSQLLSRNQMGYVPQHISLYNDFSIEENLRYFARLYGMSDKSVNIKIDDLLKLLDLPENSGIVSELSDGQKRRVSLCVALIHSPMLVILDEPTVGVDPMLRHQIWQYLDMICSKYKTTVIITTHYIEEARNASTVAYLRDGQIIAEKSPEILLNKYHCNKLEDVFLKLCENKNINIFEENSLETIEELNKENLYFQKRIVVLQHFKALFGKNILTFYRSQRLINYLFLVYSPISVLLLYLIILKHTIQYPLSYHINDGSNFSANYIRLLSSDKFKPYSLDSDSSVINSVIDGKSKLGLSFTSYIPENIENDFVRNNFGDIMTNISDINVYMDSTDISATNIAQQLYITYLKIIQKYLAANGLNPSIAEPPFHRIDIYGNSQLNVFDFSLPYFILIILFVSSYTICMNTIVKEKVEMVFERSIIAGVNSIGFYFAQLASKFILLILQILIYIVVIYPIIGSRFSDIPLIFLCLFLQGLSGISLGFLFASVISSNILSIGVSFSFIIILLSIGGGLWPVEALPSVVQYISAYVMPVTLPIKSLHCILFRDYSIGHYDVWIGFVSNIIFSIIYFTIAVIYSHFTLFRN